MKDFIAFLKKTVWLFIILFIVPLIIILIFAVKEYCLHKIDMTAGEWAGLLGSAFGYWGTVILGSLAFWQNERSHAINEKLIENEKYRNAPIFQLLWQSASSTIDFSLTNASQNTASYIEISNLDFEIVEEEQSVKKLSFPFIKSDRKDFLAPMETMKITFQGNPFHNQKFANNQVAHMKIAVSATDALGVKRITSVDIAGNEYGNNKFKYSYSVKEIENND